MTNLKCVVFSTVMILCFTFSGISGQGINSQKSGQLILAYKGFEKFLASEHSYDNYQEMVIKPYPIMKKLNETFTNWGAIDDKFPQKVRDVDEKKYQKMLSDKNEEVLKTLHESILETSSGVLAPLAPIDVCFYLTLFGDCNAFTLSGTQVVAISLKYPMKYMPLILAHEYAHCLHFQRRPAEPGSLKKSIITEGIACYFLRLMSSKYTINDALWMLQSNVDWCINNERKIINAISAELNSDSELSRKRFYNGGRRAAPLEGFPEKTGYYVGYRIVESCLKKGISLAELCLLDSQTIIDKSGLFHL